MYMILSCFQARLFSFFSFCSTLCSLVLFLHIASNKLEFSAMFLCNIVISAVILLVYNSSFNICISLFLSCVFTWFFLDKISVFVFIFPRIYHSMKS